MSAPSIQQNSWHNEHQPFDLTFDPTRVILEGEFAPFDIQELRTLEKDMFERLDIALEKRSHLSLKKVAILVSIYLDRPIQCRCDRCRQLRRPPQVSAMMQNLDQNVHFARNILITNDAAQRYRLSCYYLVVLLTILNHRIPLSELEAQRCVGSLVDVMTRVYSLVPYVKRWSGFERTVSPSEPRWPSMHQPFDLTFNPDKVVLYGPSTSYDVRGLRRFATELNTALQLGIDITSNDDLKRIALMVSIIQDRPIQCRCDRCRALPFPRYRSTRADPFFHDIFTANFRQWPRFAITFWLTKAGRKFDSSTLTRWEDALNTRTSPVYSWLHFLRTHGGMILPPRTVPQRRSIEDWIAQTLLTARTVKSETPSMPLEARQRFIAAVADGYNQCQDMVADLQTRFKEASEPDRDRLSRELRDLEAECEKLWNQLQTLQRLA